jgi:hypothetical protein
MAEAAAESLLERNKRKTLGALVRELGSTQGVPVEIISRLDALVSPRNWLVHHSQADSRRAVVTDDGRESISARLDTLTTDAGAVQKLIVEHLETELLRRGVTPEELLRRATVELRKRYGT